MMLQFQKNHPGLFIRIQKRNFISVCHSCSAVCQRPLFFIPGLLFVMPGQTRHLSLNLIMILEKDSVFPNQARDRQARNDRASGEAFFQLIWRGNFIYLATQHKFSYALHEMGWAGRYCFIIYFLFSALGIYSLARFYSNGYQSRRKIREPRILSFPVYYILSPFYFYTSHLGQAMESSFCGSQLSLGHTELFCDHGLP